MNDVQKIDRFGKLPVESDRRASENEMVVRKTLENHLTMKIFDWRKWQRVRNYALEEIEQGLTHHVEALKMSLQARLQALREGCNHELITSKAELRQKRSLFFAAKLEELTRQIDAVSDEYIARIDQRLKQLEKIENKTLRELEEKRVRDSLEGFMSTLKKLVNDFNHIIDEGVTG